MQERIIEEILQLLWTHKENKNELTPEELGNRVGHSILDTDITKMLDRGFLTVNSSGLVDFQEKGRTIAIRIVRCHRLAERLFHDILELGHKSYESTACTFEHILSHEVTDAICTLLGHPGECPHSKPIPAGECCRRAEKEIGRVIVPLSEVKSGANAKIVYIASRHHSRMDKLTSLGLIPGVEIHVHQTYPSYVIQMEQTQLALDREILQDVYVRPETAGQLVIPAGRKPLRGRRGWGRKGKNRQE